MATPASSRCAGRRMCCSAQGRRDGRGRARLCRALREACRRSTAPISRFNAAEEAGLPAITRVADRAYATYTNALNEAFFKQVATTKSLGGLGIPGVTEHLEKSVWTSTGGER